MPGNKVIIQERDRRLLESLDCLIVVDRQQAQRIAPFASTPRANARLLALTRAGVLRRSFIPAGAFGQKAIYSLPRKHSSRRQLAGRAAHQLRLNDVYLWLRDQSEEHVRLSTWRTGLVPLRGVRLIPDAHVELEAPQGRLLMFIEADCGTEPLSVWRKKVDKYLMYARSGAAELDFHHPQFRVLVLTPTMRRAQSIAAAVGELTTKLFWVSSLENINQADCFASVWLRPGGGTAVPLISSCDTVDYASASVQVSRDSVRPVGEATM